LKKNFLFLGFITILLLALSSCSSKDESVRFEGEGETGKLEGTDNETEGKINLNSNCSGCATQSSKVPYHVTIKWNGKEDKFDLKAK